MLLNCEWRLKNEICGIIRAMAQQLSWQRSETAFLSSSYPFNYFNFFFG
jgi:hypothetical protein